MIDLAKARELLKAAVDTQGAEFVYNPNGIGVCQYEPLEKDSPRSYGEDDPRHITGCLVGTALTIHGETRHLGFMGSVSALVTEYPQMMTIQAADYFWAAQIAQDDGKTWGYALERAEVTAARYMEEVA